MTEKILLKQSSTGTTMAYRSSHRVTSQIAEAMLANDNHIVIEQVGIPPAGRGQLAIKRLIDVAGAFTGLLILAPLLVLIGLAIRLDSRGPVFFRQIRTGRDEIPFEILKFRSMRVDGCDRSGIRQTVEADPRVTRVGRFLRRTSLDEIPQLWNVLIGDMSLVGPRPHVPDMLAAGIDYATLVKGYETRHLMRPGLTGLAQARGFRGPTIQPVAATLRIVCDVEYIRTFSLMLDAKIIMQTLFNELTGGTGS